MGKKKEAESKPENYTIFHALVEALQDKNKAEEEEQGKFLARLFWHRR